MDFYRPQICPNCKSWNIELGGFSLDIECPITGLKMSIYRCRDCGWKSDPVKQRNESAERMGNFFIALGKKYKEKIK